jgi:hypothetical protein
VLTALFAVLPLALAIDAEPDPTDLLMFPHPSVCAVNIVHATEYLAYLDALAPIYPTYVGLFHECRTDAAWRLEAWRLLDWCWQAGPDSRRGALGRLREVLGGERFYSGTMPPAFPIADY